MTLTDQCPRVEHLNICGLNRVTEIGTRAICAHFWHLSYLNVEDVFLLNDTPIPEGSTLEILSGNKLALQTTDILKIDCSIADKVSVALTIMEIT